MAAVIKTRKRELLFLVGTVVVAGIVALIDKSVHSGMVWGFGFDMGLLVGALIFRSSD